MSSVGLNPTSSSNIMNKLRRIYRKLKAWVLWKFFGKIECIKPSGTISLYIDNGSGIHPRFDRYYHRKLILPPSSGGWNRDDGRAAYTGTNFRSYMRQIAPDSTILKSLVNVLTYKENWRFELADLDRGQGSEGLTFSIYVTAPDSVHPGRSITVVHYMIVPPASYNERSWRRWLLTQILLVEQHETCEFFRIDNERVFGPNHGPGNDPYTIFDQGTKEDAEVNYLGVK